MARSTGQLVDAALGKTKGAVVAVGKKLKGVGGKMAAGGKRAAAHVKRNRAAYIAGGLGTAAGAGGMYYLGRKNQNQD